MFSAIAGVAWLKAHATGDAIFGVPYKMDRVIQSPLDQKKHEKLVQTGLATTPADDGRTAGAPRQKSDDSQVDATHQSHGARLAVRARHALRRTRRTDRIGSAAADKPLLLSKRNCSCAVFN